MCLSHSYYVSLSLLLCVSLTLTMCLSHSYYVSLSLLLCVSLTLTMCLSHSYYVSLSLLLCVSLTLTMCLSHSYYVSLSLLLCVSLSLTMCLSHSYYVSLSLLLCVSLTLTMCLSHYTALSPLHFCRVHQMFAPEREQQESSAQWVDMQIYDQPSSAQSLTNVSAQENSTIFVINLQPIRLRRGATPELIRQHNTHCDKYIPIVKNLITWIDI